MNWRLELATFSERYPLVTILSIYAFFSIVFSTVFGDEFHSLLESFFRTFLDNNRSERLTKEISRKSFHLLGLVIVPLMDIFEDHAQLVSLSLLALSLLAFVVDEVRLHWSFLNDICGKTPFMRPSERETLTGIPTFLLGVSSAVFFRSKIAVYALLFGDTAAALGGIAFGRTKLTDRKTLEGFLFFVMAVLLCCPECGATYANGLLYGIVGGLCELLCEKVRINDNLLIPLGVALSQFLVQHVAQ